MPFPYWSTTMDTRESTVKWQLLYCRPESVQRVPWMWSNGDCHGDPAKQPPSEAAGLWIVASQRRLKNSYLQPYFFSDSQSCLSKYTFVFYFNGMPEELSKKCKNKRLLPPPPSSIWLIPPSLSPFNPPASTFPPYSHPRLISSFCTPHHIYLKKKFQQG